MTTTEAVSVNCVFLVDDDLTAEAASGLLGELGVSDFFVCVNVGTTALGTRRFLIGCEPNGKP